MQSRKYRKVGNHGDTLMAHNTNLSFSQATEIETNFDFSSTSAYILNDHLLIIIALYNPPQNSKYRFSDTDLQSSIVVVLFNLESLFDSSTQQKLILMNGDVNFSHTDRNTLSRKEKTKKNSIKKFLRRSRCSEPLLNHKLQLLTRDISMQKSGAM